MLHAASRKAPTAPISPHRAGVHRDVLRQITAHGVNLSIWQRPTQPLICRELSVLEARDLRDVRRPTSQRTLGQDINALLQQQGLEPAALKHWRADLLALGALFFDVAKGRDVHFRLFTTDQDDCRRFHVDRTFVRLLCTYQGPGTEWLANEQVDRVAQARCAPNDAIVRFGEPSSLEPFWVAMLKGDPGNSGEGVVHRSPPVEGTGQIRVLFCLDC